LSLGKVEVDQAVFDGGNGAEFYSFHVHDEAIYLATRNPKLLKFGMLIASFKFFTAVSQCL